MPAFFLSVHSKYILKKINDKTIGLYVQVKNGALKGGFISEEHFGKDEAQYLENNILEYELILQQNGNFSTSPSNPEEAL